MRITYKGDYALKTMLDLARCYGSGPVTIHDLARRTDVPTKFLEQILLDLKRAGFLESKRGKIGGYLLARHPSKIKLGEIIRFIDGPIEPIACVEKNYSGCADMQGCVFRNIWQQVALSTAKIIDNITFEELLKGLRKQNTSFIYHI